MQSQLSTKLGFGTVSIDTGTNRVRGTSVLANWASAVAGNAWFSLIGDEAAPVTIVDFTPPGESASGQWEATLQQVYTLPSVVNADYVIHVAFITSGLP